MKKSYGCIIYANLLYSREMPVMLRLLFCVMVDRNTQVVLDAIASAKLWLELK